jgi:TolB protein
MPLKKICFFTLLWLLANPLWAALTIEIRGGAANRIPIAIVPFDGEFSSPHAVSEVITNDLVRSGFFATVDTQGIRVSPAAFHQVDYSRFLGLRTQATVIGLVEPQGSRVKVSFRLLDPLQQKQLAAMEFYGSMNAMRLIAHQIADIIYEKLLGVPGAFASKIAYVVKNSDGFSLQVADSDAFNPQVILRSPEPIISPTWSLDGSRLAYVSFEHKKPQIYIQSLATGSRSMFSKEGRQFSAPAFSPDGGRLIFAGSSGGYTKIFMAAIDGSGLHQVTYGSFNDTEPKWSQDGRWIYFTSDRGGTPQIYRMHPDGSGAERVTFDGPYNVSPSIAPDGKHLAFIHRENGMDTVAVLDLATRQLTIADDNDNNESPSMAPNGQMVIYAKRSGRGVLATASVDGSARQVLREATGDVREPAWGPKLSTE